jgi:hypothetical protein
MAEETCRHARGGHDLGVANAMIDTIRTVDDIFLRMADATPQNWGVRLGLPIGDAVEEMWTLLESGDLRLVVEGERLRVEPFAGPQAERLLVAEQHWPLIAARRRVLCALYDDR